MSSLLSSQGKTGSILRIGLLTLLVGMPLSFILIPRFGILGFILNNLITQAISTFLYIYTVRRLFKFKMWIGQSIRTYFASFTMGGLVWVTLRVFRLWVGIDNGGILLGAGFFVGIFSYFLLLPLTGAIDLEELKKINILFSEWGFLSSLYNIFSTTMKKVIILRKKIIIHKNSFRGRA